MGQLALSCLEPRLAYRAGVRAWCAWCDRYALPCLPGRTADVVAFLASDRGRSLSVSIVGLRLAAFRYLNFAAGCPVPTAEAQVAETMAGMRHQSDPAEATRPPPQLRRAGRVFAVWRPVRRTSARLGSVGGPGVRPQWRPARSGRWPLPTD